MLVLVFKLPILIALVKVLTATNKPVLCAGLYTFFSVCIQLAFSPPLGELAVRGGVGFALALLYFWLLDKLEGAEGLWWTVAIIGALIGLV